MFELNCTISIVVILVIVIVIRDATQNRNDDEQAAKFSHEEHMACLYLRQRTMAHGMYVCGKTKAPVKSSTR
jgi:hypothetical protein